jgi:hypothetical protein
LQEKHLIGRRRRRKPEAFVQQRCSNTALERLS